MFVVAITWSASAARKNMMFLLPNPLLAADHIRVVTTSEGDVFITEKRKLPCVEYIARGMQYATVDSDGLSKKHGALQTESHECAAHSISGSLR